MSISPGPWKWGYLYTSEERPEDNEMQDLAGLYDAEGVRVAEYSDYGWQKRHKTNALADMAAIAKVPEMVAMLRRLEWSGLFVHQHALGSMEVGEACPCCGTRRPKDPRQPRTHKDDCELAALLKDIL